MSRQPYQYIHVRHGRGRPGVSALGLTSLVFGLLALFAGLVPFCGAVVAIPLGIFGLVLAIVGFIGASAGGTKGVGVPFLGVLVCVGAIIFPIIVTGGLIGLIMHEREDAERKMMERNAAATRPATLPTTRAATRPARPATRP